MENSRFKFRAWDKEEQKFHYDTIAGHRDGSVFIGHIGYFQGTLEQFTGLHDSQGVEIYEGDRVKHENFPDDTEEVYWNDEELCFACRGGKNGESWLDNGYKVCGTIHDSEA